MQVDIKGFLLRCAAADKIGNTEIVYDSMREASALISFYIFNLKTYEYCCLNFSHTINNPANSIIFRFNIRFSILFQHCLFLDLLTVYTLFT